MTEFLSKINFKVALFWLAAIMILDVVAGSIFLPQRLKEIHKLSSLDLYYNHGFNKNVEGFKTFGPLRYMMHTNSMAMVDEKIRTVKKEDKSKRRILFIGDSFTEGLGSEYPQTFCGRLKNKVDSNTVEILNAGVASYSPKLYYLRTKYLLEEEGLKVNELFCFIDFSDIGDELVYEDFVPQKRALPKYIVPFWANNSIIFNLFHKIRMQKFCDKAGISKDQPESFFYWASTNEDFLERYHDFWNIRQSWWYYDDSNPTLQHAIQLAFSNMNNLKNLCAKNNIHLTVVVYPQSYALLETRGAARCSKLWEDYCKKEAIDFISLYPLFITSSVAQNAINRKLFYIKDDSHWNAEGHKAVADSIYSYIKAR